MRPKLSANNPRIVVEMPSANCPTIISTALSLRPTPRTCGENYYWRKSEIYSLTFWKKSSKYVNHIEAQISLQTCPRPYPKMVNLDNFFTDICMCLLSVSVKSNRISIK